MNIYFSYLHSLRIVRVLKLIVLAAQNIASMLINVENSWKWNMVFNIPPTLHLSILKLVDFTSAFAWVSTNGENSKERPRGFTGIIALRYNLRKEHCLKLCTNAIVSLKPKITVKIALLFKYLHLNWNIWLQYYCNIIRILELVEFM